MLHDFTSPVSANNLDNTDATGMTHRTASQSFEQRREIERQRTTIGSYEAAAKKVLIETQTSHLTGGESNVPRADYYNELRQSIGIKTDDTKRNPYNADRQANRSSAGREDKYSSRQSLNAKTGGLSIPKRPTRATFHEPQGRSFNPYE